MEKLRRLLTENLSLKVLSVILGFFLWLFVKGSTREEVAVVVPVELEKVPSKLCVRDINPPSVTVRLRGVLHQLNRLRIEELSVRLDMSDAQPGVNTFLLRSEDFSLPPGIEVLRISPAEVRVKLSPLVTKRVQVKAILRGEPAEGMEVAKVEVLPPFAMIQGPQELVKDLTEIRTEEINLNGASRDLELEVPLAISELPLRSCQPSKVKVKVKLQVKS